MTPIYVENIAHLVLIPHSKPKLLDLASFLADPVRLGNHTYRVWRKNQSEEWRIAWLYLLAMSSLTTFVINVIIPVEMMQRDSEGILLILASLFGSHPQKENTMLNNMNNQEILDTKLEEFAYTLLKKFEKEPNIKIAEGILDCFQDRDIKVRRSVEEAIQWLCNNGLIAPRVINGYYTENHFITRKGVKKLQEKKHE